MSEVALDSLRIALLALLPSEGSPMTVKALAAAACVSPAAVTDALFDDWLDSRINFNVRADAFSAIKKGNRL
jgi:hypothetical protein